jgi:hypothetical protein
MKIYLKKFGTTLVSRQAGREALAAFQPTMKKLSGKETVKVYFEGVTTLSPSWGDEFLRPLDEKHKKRLILLRSKNPSVILTLKILEQANKMKFNLENK